MFSFTMKYESEYCSQSGFCWEWIHLFSLFHCKFWLRTKNFHFVSCDKIHYSCLLFTRTVRSITVRSRREFSFIRVKAIVDHGCKPGRMGLIDQDASNSKRKVKSPLQYSLRWTNVQSSSVCATSVITQPTATGVKANATVTNQIIPHSTLRRSTCMNNWHFSNSWL